MEPLIPRLRRQDWCDQCGAYTRCKHCWVCLALLCRRCWGIPHQPPGLALPCYGEFHDNSHNSSTTSHTNRQI